MIHLTFYFLITYEVFIIFDNIQRILAQILGVYVRHKTWFWY